MSNLHLQDAAENLGLAAEQAITRLYEIDNPSIERQGAGRIYEMFTQYKDAYLPPETPDSALSDLLPGFPFDQMPVKNSPASDAVRAREFAGVLCCNRYELRKLFDEHSYLFKLFPAKAPPPYCSSLMPGYEWWHAHETIPCQCEILLIELDKLASECSKSIKIPVTDFRPTNETAIADSILQSVERDGIPSWMKRVHEADYATLYLVGHEWESVVDSIVNADGIPIQKNAKLTSNKRRPKRTFADKTADEAKILKYLESKPDATRDEIAEGTGIAAAHVSTSKTWHETTRQRRFARMAKRATPTANMDQFAEPDDA